MASLLPTSQAPSQRHASPGTETNEFFVPARAGPHRKRKKFVLCFDGTGNKFSGTDSDSNILKIYRMLDRNDESQFHYYQPGIGTYVVSKSYSHTSRIDRLKSWYAKAKDSAVGTSFDEHVMAGYRFLMRYYIPGDDIYFFGFSRGAYTARFLAEMLDHIGLLSAGNEEMCHFAWKTFQKWQVRQERTEKEKDDKKYLLDFMCAFRETFSRPVRRIRFLGLFDTVNSVPRFENAWMQRSKFPYTARSSAKVVRHAVAIDERRAKFRQDLISETKPKKTHHYHHRRQRVLHPFNLSAIDEVEQQARGRPSADTHRYNPSRRGTLMPPEQEMFRDGSDTRGIRSLSPGLSPNGRSENDRPSSAATSISETSMAAIRHYDDDEDSDGEEQDIREVWFAGCHADIGGGWPLGDGEDSALSHIPLVWMVKESQSAGLHFDEVKLKALNCCPDEIQRRKSTVVPQIEIDPASPDPEVGPSSGLPHRLRPQTTTSSVGSKPSRFHTLLEAAACKGKIHDVLQFGNGVSRASVISWNMMEYLPFRRMDLQEDGSWKSITWPLPKGETRDVPDNAVIHNSVIKRMETNPSYRPGNLIVGGGGRGVRTAPAKYGMGKWIVCRAEGDPVGEVLVRAAPPEKRRSENGVTNMGHTPLGPQGVWISANR